MKWGGGKREIKLPSQLSKICSLLEALITSWFLQRKLKETEGLAADTKSSLFSPGKLSSMMMYISRTQ